MSHIDTLRRLSRPDTADSDRDAGTERSGGVSTGRGSAGGRGRGGVSRPGSKGGTSTGSRSGSVAASVSGSHDGGGPSRDSEAHGGGKDSGDGNLEAKYKEVASDTTAVEPTHKVMSPKTMKDRFDETGEELIEYAARKTGVEKALELLARLEREVQEACEVDTRTTYTEDEMQRVVDEMREGRRTAEVRVVDLEAELLKVRGERDFQVRRVGMLETQKREEMNGVIDGFSRLSKWMDTTRRTAMKSLDGFAERLDRLQTKVITAEFTGVVGAIDHADAESTHESEYSEIPDVPAKTLQVLTSRLKVTEAELAEKNQLIDKLRRAQKHQVSLLKKKVKDIHDELRNLKERQADAEEEAKGE